MSLEVIKSGLCDTVQDSGRYRFAAIGVNPGGPMDWHAAGMANALLGNDINAALLEHYYPAATFRVLDDCRLAIAGADFCCSVNGVSVGHNRSFAVRKNDTITYTQKKAGEIAYLAIQGGFHLPMIMGSTATNLLCAFGGMQGRRLQAGDLLQCVANSDTLVTDINTKLTFTANRSNDTIAVMEGAEWQQLNSSQQHQILACMWEKSTQANRMGIALHSSAWLRPEIAGIISSPVSMGTVQQIPDGSLMVLAADHQTIGGYARILQIARSSLPDVVQLPPRAAFRFEMISAAEAITRESNMKLQIANMRTVVLTNRLYEKSK